MSWRGIIRNWSYNSNNVNLEIRFRTSIDVFIGLAVQVQFKCPISANYNFDTVKIQILFYGAESRTLSIADKNSLGTFESKVLLRENTDEEWIVRFISFIVLLNYSDVDKARKRDPKKEKTKYTKTKILAVHGSLIYCRRKRTSSKICYNLT